MQQPYPDEDNEHNVAGDYAHALAAQALYGVDVPAGTEPEMVDAVEIYVNDVRSHVNGDLYVEQSISVPRVHSQSFGTVDARCCDGRVLILWDFKYGFKLVNAYENWQLLNYAAGMVDMFPDLEQVQLRIVQPRAFNYRGPVDTWTLSVVELFKYITTLTEQAHHALGPDPYCFVGEHCRYCRARHACEALRNASAGVLDNRSEPVLHELDNKALAWELSHLQEEIKLIEYRITAMEEQVSANIKSGQVVPGYSLRPGGGRESWDVPDAQIIAMGTLLKKNLSAPAKALTPAQARKAGIDSATVKQFTKAITGTKLVRDSLSDARRIFGGK
jgi:hypothetical protein